MTNQDISKNFYFINSVILKLIIAFILLFFTTSIFAAGINKELRLAAKANNVGEIKRLLKAGADLNASGKKRGRTALHVAAKQGNLDAVKYLISVGADYNTSSSKGRSPLHHASIKGKREVVEFLIGAGANVNTSSNNGATPLISAAYKGHTGIVQALLAQGAYTSLKTNKGNSAMDLAVKYEFIETVHVLKMRKNATGVVVSLHTPKEKIQEIFQAAVTKALEGRGWTTTSEKQNVIKGQLIKGRRIFRVVVELVKNSISINFVPYYGFHRQNYLKNIKNDLEKILVKGF